MQYGGLIHVHKPFFNCRDKSQSSMSGNFSFFVPEGNRNILERATFSFEFRNVVCFVVCRIPEREKLFRAPQELLWGPVFKTVCTAEARTFIADPGIPSIIKHILASNGRYVFFSEKREPFGYHNNRKKGNETKKA